VADAEPTNPAGAGLAQWTNNTQSGGIITAESTIVIHGTKSFQFQYNGTGNPTYLIKNAGLNPGSVPTLFGRFYIQLDSYFAMTGINPQLVIAEFGPSTNPLILSLVYNSIDRKYKLSGS